MSNLATIPELWPRLALLRLTQNSVALPTVNRQYSEELAREGQTVHAHRARNRKVRRKSATGNYTAVATESDQVDVKLDQVFYDSTVIKAHEQSLSMTDLIRLHLNPMVDTIVRGVDRAILGHVYSFMHQGSPAKRVGKLRGVTPTNCYQFITESNQVLNQAYAPEGQKTLMVDPTLRTVFKQNELFVSAEKRGDGGATLRGRQIGVIDDFNVVMGHNVSYVDATLADTQASTTTEPRAAGYAGAHAITDPGTNPTVGEYFVFEENGQPTYITATGGGTDVTLNEALKYAILDNSVATHYLKCVNEATERAAGYSEEMTFTHTSGKYLQVGQLLSFGTTSRQDYSIIERTIVDATHTRVLLNRPLAVTVASGADAFPGPAGVAAVTWHEDALAFVSRPMHNWGGQFGAQEVVFAADGIAVLMTMQYDSDEGGVKINLTLLAGLAVLNEDLGCAYLG